MKKSSDFINESVFTTNLKILRKQNETKELFFRCLDENRDYYYFKEQLEKIWDNLDYSFLQEQLKEYEEIIHIQNIEKRKEVEIKEKNNLLPLVPLGVILTQESRLINYKLRDYKNSLNSYAYQNNKEEYLKLKVPQYKDNIVEYVSHTGGKSRYVELSTYTSMIQNTNLTRTAWNTTLNDADNLNIERFYIPYHSFSCPDCIEHQNIIYTKEELIRMIDIAEEAEGDILHPNCKCIIVMLGDGEKMIKTSSLTKDEKEESYNIRQKANSLTLEKERLLTDLKIYRSFKENEGMQDMIDKYNQKIRKINSEIKELKSQLPTEELQKQVIAIKR